jgi:hypothetical protein
LLVCGLEDSTFTSTLSRLVVRRRALALAPSLPIPPSGKSLLRRLELFLRLLRLRFELRFDRGVQLPGLFEAVLFFAAEAVGAAC